jgi:hypothetical protein
MGGVSRSFGLTSDYHGECIFEAIVVQTAGSHGPLLFRCVW